jgi:hypothetical protein
MQALASGDPRIIEKVNLEMDVEKLKILRNSFKEEQFKLTDLVRKNTENIEFNKNILSKSETDTAKFLSEKTDEKPQIIIDGKTFAERKDCGERLNLLIAKALKEEVGTEILVGEIGGFELKLKLCQTLSGKCIDGVIKGELAYSTALSPDNALGNITRIENAFANIPKRVDAVKQKIERLENDKKEAEMHLGEEFTQEEEFQTKNARLQELNAIFAVEDTSVIAVGNEDEEISMSDKPAFTAENSEKNSARLEM